ncbi:hypothetical protein FYJ28_00880 [Arthrobacter sp. BL-252-APC-1A]|uniref:hypothetical protein n=1 Tax=Arthrobacter sp. BL-252-APC-1A TaxID=2606622 RepID=UPI0012B2A4C7|nr:hypothetical protein [Arthrobacter sp. BL-252-APC-1A]MSR97383.1 hypothetical protein [Arthrobacter sp. BL-252-APC-1A]
MGETQAKTERSPVGADPEGPVSAADAAAGASLLCAVGAGAVLALLLESSGNGGFTPPWEPLDLSVILPGELYMLRVLLPFLVPAGLIFCAYFFVARTESRLNLRRQRGALALLGFGAVLLGFPLGGSSFSGVYGAALLALAVRTRETLTVATGVMALAAYVGTSFLSAGWTVLPVLGFMAAAALTAAVRVGKSG